MRTIDDWLDEYGASHTNRVNKRLHWICVPIIVWCVLGVAWLLPVPEYLRRLTPFLNWGTLIAAAGVLYYLRLAPLLAFGMIPILVLMFTLMHGVDSWGYAWRWGIYLGLFVIAWIGQFIGHDIEGRRPSFFKDIQFLLIGPLWLLADVYRRWGWRT